MLRLRSATEANCFQMEIKGISGYDANIFLKINLRQPTSPCFMITIISNECEIADLDRLNIL